MVQDWFVLFACILGGICLAWFLNLGRPSDRVATAAGVAVGVTIGYAIKDSVLFLLALAVLLPFLLWRTRFRRRPAS